MSAHTRGPWTCSRILGGDQWMIATDTPKGRVELATVYADAEYLPHLPVEANAVLIAAAPELLAALKLAQPVLERLALDGPGGNSVAEDIRDAIRAALTKAEGRP